MNDIRAIQTCICGIDDCVLCKARLFSSLSTKQVCEIRDIINNHIFQVRDTLFHEGEPATHLYIIKEGVVKLSTSLPDGREQILSPRVAGQMVGFNRVEDKVYPYTAEALTWMDTCSVRHQDMLQILQQNPETSMHLIGLLSQELGHSQMMIRNLGLKNSREKVASFILYMIPVGETSPENIPLPFSRREIAEMLGLTVETVSRVMSWFRREGIIQTPRGEICILDIARLRTLAGDLSIHPEWSPALRA